MAQQIKVTFEPILTLTRRADGGWDAEVDWSSGCLGEYDETKGTWDDESDAAGEASAALDRWIAQQPQTFTIPGD